MNYGKIAGATLNREEKHAASGQLLQPGRHQGAYLQPLLHLNQRKADCITETCKATSGKFP